MSHHLLYTQETTISTEYYKEYIGFVLTDLQSDTIFYCQSGDVQKKILVEMKNSGTCAIDALYLRPLQLR